MSKNIEVEIRSFITKNQYNDLIKFFKKNAELVSKDNQETIYFDCKEDLRIQKNDHYSKIWLKKGKLHDDFREEVEIHTEKENFENLKKLFGALGYKEEIRWIRKRMEFKWNGITVDVDYTVGYGYILELEKITSTRKEKEALIELRDLLKELKITETSKRVFDEAYASYKENWRNLIKNTK